MLGLLLLLFVALPITELIILIRLGQAFGLLTTAGLVLGTGVAGAVLARSEGMRTMRAMQRELAAGHVPGREILDGIAVLVGGALLLTPGLITDVAGLSLLFPLTRHGLQRLARRWLARQLRTGALQGGVLRWDAGMAGPWERRGDGPPGSESGPAGRRLDPRNEIRVPPSEERS